MRGTVLASATVTVFDHHNAIPSPPMMPHHGIMSLVGRDSTVTVWDATSTRATPVCPGTGGSAATPMIRDRVRQPLTRPGFMPVYVLFKRRRLGGGVSLRE